MWSLDLEDIEKETGKIIRRCTASERTIAGDKVCFYKGQVLYSKLRPYLKKVLVAPDDGICSSEMVPFSPYGDIDSQYLVYVLISPHVDYIINSVTYGVKMPNLLSTCDDPLQNVDEEKFLHNLYHGSIAAVFIVNLYETALNTIISRRINSTEFQPNHHKRLEYICNQYRIDPSEIKSTQAYKVTQSLINLRNDITHYKNNEVSTGHYFTSDTKFSIGKSEKAFVSLFTKMNMERSYRSVLELLELLCSKCRLTINEECEIIDSDGRDDLCEFIMDKRTLVD